MSEAESDLRRGSPPAEIIRADPPMIATEDVPTCPYCGSPKHEQVATGFDYELQTCANQWRFVKCGQCDLLRLHPRPAVTALDVIYPSAYYAYNYDKISPIARAGKSLLDRAKFRGIRRHVATPPASYLDVGCGDGRYLRLMEREGIPRSSLYGLELSESVVAPLAKQGYRVFNDRVEDCARIPDGGVDLITMFHVIEHVDNPRAVVERLVDWLSDGGLLALETPNVDSLDRRLFTRTWWGGYHIPRHWTLFSASGLKGLLEDCGLEVVLTRYQPGHAFWMYSLHHRLRYGRRPHPRLAALFDPFNFVPTLAAFTAFDKARAAFGAKTSAMLMLARKKT